MAITNVEILCLFCEQRGPRASEHIWPDWIGKRLSRRGYVRTARLAGEGRTTISSKRLAFTQRLRDVCKACNTRWMSRIERAASPILEPMIFAQQPTSLGWDDQQRVAAWANLRAMILQHAAGQDGIPKRYYREAANTGGKPRQHSFIWLGSMDNMDHNQAYFYSSTLDYVENPLLRGSESEAYVSTFAVGYLVVRVFLHSPLLQRSGQLAEVRNERMWSYLTPIWLPAPTIVRWPPWVLSVDGFADLARTPPIALLLP